MKPAARIALLGYSVVMATVAAGVAAAVAFGEPKRVSYDVIDVARINVREDDGRLRMLISNESHFPGLIFRGKEHPHPNRKTAGLLFFNETGTENGGLLFGGKTENGRVESGGHLSFDQYEQDQVIQLTHSESGGRRWAGLVVHDYADGPMDLDAWEKAEAMLSGAAKDAELQRLSERYGPKRRLFLGKTRDRNSDLGLSDAAGRPRLRMRVTAGGAASIEFLDEAGKTVRTLDP